MSLNRTNLFPPDTALPQTYRGRFAPSPTGPLHFGSLCTAVASFLDARAHQGQWLLRMEDLDQTRCNQRSAEKIVRTLEAFELHWDNNDSLPLIVQSQRQARYQHILDELIEQKLAYPCVCTRKQIRETAKVGIEGPIYPGTCRNLSQAATSSCAWRLLTKDQWLSFNDRIQGTQYYNIQQQLGDFIIKRADQLFAYQLAVVIDDADQKITHVTRGIDLMISTIRQIYLQQQLQLPQPIYLHLPIAVNAQGYKLSKQNHAPEINTENIPATLFRILQFLKQSPPQELQTSTTHELLDWGIHHWQPEALRQCQKIVISSDDQNRRDSQELSR